MIDLKKINAVDISQNASSMTHVLDYRGHIFFIVSNIPGEPFLPGELSFAVNRYRDFYQMQRESFAAEGTTQFPEKLEGAVQIIKLSPHPTQPGKWITFTFDAADEYKYMY